MTPATRGRNALGKGLGALIAPPRYPNLDDNYFMCRIELLDADPDQPRQTFDDATLLQLVASIKEKGVLQPLLVRRSKDGRGDRYTVIAGERRLRASRLAGLREVPVVVKEVAGEEAFEIALIENIQRDDLNPIEEALAYQRLLDRAGSTQETVARKVGKDRSTVANSMRLLRLPHDVQGHVIDGRLSSGHARTILSVGDTDNRDRLVAMILADQMSVRQAEQTAKKLNVTGPAKPRKVRRQALKPYFDSVAAELSEALGSNVEVQARGRKGRIQIAFESIEDLRRLRDALL
jgi:ParB family chromosome partitioning protein